MAVIDQFIGQRVMIPEDRRYHLYQGLWGRLEDRTIRFGLSQPKLALCGGLKDLDWIVDSGSTVSAGDTIIFAITEKFLYLDAPISGIIQYFLENFRIFIFSQILSTKMNRKGPRHETGKKVADRGHV